MKTNYLSGSTQPFCHNTPKAKSVIYAIALLTAVNMVSADVQPRHPLGIYRAGITL